MPRTGYTGTLTAGLTFRAWDQTTGTHTGTADTRTNGGGTAYSTATNTVRVDVLPPNNAPTLDALGAFKLTDVRRNDFTNAGTRVRDLLASGGGLDDIDAGAVAGIAVTQVTATNGAWQFSRDGSRTWASLAARSDQFAM